MKNVFIGLFVLGLVAIGALDVQKTTRQAIRIVVTVLGGQPDPVQTQQQYQFPTQSDRYAPASDGIEQ